MAVKPLEKKEQKKVQYDSKGNEVLGEGPVPAFAKVVVGPNGEVQRYTRSGFEQQKTNMRKEEVTQNILDSISARGGETPLNMQQQNPNFVQQAIQQQQLQQQQDLTGRAQALEQSGATRQEQLKEGVLPTSSSLTGGEKGVVGNLISTLLPGLDVATTLFSTEGAGQAIRNAFGVDLTEEQINNIRRLNPEQGEEYIQRIKLKAVENKNRKFGIKVAEAIGAVSEGLPLFNFAVSKTTIQTPAKKIQTIASTVGAYESVGDKLGLAGRADPQGTIDQINRNIDNLNDMEAELQNLILVSPEYQASGEAQTIAIRINTVRQNLVNKRDVITGQYLYNVDTPTPAQLQAIEDELDKALKNPLKKDI